MDVQYIMYVSAKVGHVCAVSYSSAQYGEEHFGGAGA